MSDDLDFTDDTSSAPNTSNVWDMQGTSFHPSSTATHVQHLEPGVYRYAKNMNGWWLEKERNHFEFPYKIYGEHSHILNRIKKAWQYHKGNLGTLLNGVKGTGKTVTAQLVGNWAIEQGMPVLVVQDPVPLALILGRIEQDCVVIFDEFEKTHRLMDDQQALLSAVDGMARNAHRRLFLFTSNSKHVEENFLDRPSRIRYCWEFNRLGDDVIEQLMDDLLEPHLWTHRAAISSYLATRKVCSIDVAKTVINEVNIFEEPPEAFAENMNLSELDVRAFVLELLDAKGETVRTLHDYFSLSAAECRQLRRHLTKSGGLAFQENFGNYDQQRVFTHKSYDRDRGGTVLELVKPTLDPSIWECRIKVPVQDTWFAKMEWIASRFYNGNVWVDEKPEGWDLPQWVKNSLNANGTQSDLDDEDVPVTKGRKKPAKKEQVYDYQALNKFVQNESMYGGEPATFLVRITPKIEQSYTYKGPAEAF